ncbi:MAG: hypothetical protein SOY45_08040 [Lachnospiraceae bacterium]|nr:hypothetical protein [Lachnospiraceae bacterium]MDD7147931.1 hypothetical protein [Lachnospiraceae bacterium]MDY4069813.1 hypothetical protein [Lachnospiraceae bacterium]
MLNEEKIKLMTRMAAYEENEGKRSMQIGNYFRSDYIGLQVMKSVISATIAFAIVIAMYIFYDFESVMKEIYQVDLLVTGKQILIAYVVFVGIYAVITYIIYAYRYTKAKKSLKKYYTHLTELSGFYDEIRR